VTTLLGVLLGLGLDLISSVVFWRKSSIPVRTSSPTPVHRISALLRDRLTQAGMERVSVAVFAVLSVFIGMVAGSVIFGVTSVAPLGFAAGTLGVAVPWLVTGWRALARKKARRTLWPDVVDTLVSSVRSGLALPEGVAALAQTGPLTMRGSFSDFERSYRSTGNFSVVLDEL